MNFLLAALCTVRVGCVAIFGVSSKEEMDLSFIFAGSVIVGASEASTSALGGNAWSLIA